MYTPQPIEPLTPRFRIKPGTAAAAIGVLVAIAMTIMFVNLTSTTHHTTVAIGLTTSQPAASATPHTHYLGPHQQQTPTGSNGLASAAANTAAHHACLGAPQRCLR